MEKSNTYGSNCRTSQLSVALASAQGHCPHCNWISPRLRL